MFGFGTGVFFIAYFFFEVPSNLLLERFGARRWIARIMFTWGVLAALMAYIPHIAQATGLSNAYVSMACAFCSASQKQAFSPASSFC